MSTAKRSASERAPRVSLCASAVQSAMSAGSFFFSSRRRHTRCLSDWSSDVCSSDLGLGSAMIVDGIVEPMELGHLPYKRRTFEDYVGVRGFERLGKKKWRQHVADVIARLIAALEPEDVVLGGGNVKKLKELPPGCRAGNNANAFAGGFRLWQKTSRRNASTS